jgi:two-component system NtrC family sensor kinase
VADPLKMPALSAITQAESLERCFQELVATYRHSAAGRRCHGIIHNLNTPLQALSFQLDLLLHQAGEEERLLANLGETAAPLQPLAAERRRRLGQMGLEVEQLKALVQRLFYQGLHEDADWVCLDLNRLYEEELSLYQENSFFKHQVAKEIRLSGDLPPLTGRYIDLAQSFRNLVDNALEAMATVSRRVLRVVTHCSMGIRFIRIGDCGPGIPSDLLPHLGTPFVTTKGHRSPGHAGLGLFLAKRLLAPYGGSLKVESRPGETWVTILLPT